MLFKPLYIPVWDLNGPGGNRRDRVALIRGQGSCLGSELKARASRPSSCALRGREEVSVRAWGGLVGTLSLFIHV